MKRGDRETNWDTNSTHSLELRFSLALSKSIASCFSKDILCRNCCLFTVLMLFTVLCFCSKYRTQRVPELIPKPTVAQLLDETTTRRVYIYGIQDDNGTDIQNFSLDLTPPPDVIMKTSPGTSEGMNVLGIVIFSATMGKWLAWILHSSFHMSNAHTLHKHNCSLRTPPFLHN